MRHELTDDLDRRRLPRSVVEAAALVVSELVGNAVRHGDALPGGGLVARWSLRRRDLHLEVEDGGHGPAPRDEAPMASADAEGGRGLALVDALALRWGSRCRPSGTTVWADLPVASGADRHPS